MLGAIRPVSTRPAAAGLRRPGHWEGDLIIGAKNRSAIVTLVCRASRFTLLADLPNGHCAPDVTAALVELFERIPAHLRTTLTRDQGREMATGPTRSPHRRAHDLLLRPALPVATAHEREHQRHPAALAAQGHRPQRALPY